MGFFSYGGLVAMQTLWAGPWMVKVSGYTPLEAATGLFWVNVSMMLTFWLWGLVTPHLHARGFDANRLMTYGVPLAISWCRFSPSLPPVPMLLVRWRGPCFAVSNSFVALSQPAVGMAFPPALAGRRFVRLQLGVVFRGFCGAVGHRPDGGWLYIARPV
jgi:hypothetical protein